MNILDITYPGMEGMDFHEKKRIILAAMGKAEIKKKTNVMYILYFLIFVGPIVMPIICWISTGQALLTLLYLFISSLVIAFVFNKMAKSYYIPFINEAINEQDIILGDKETRKERKKRKEMFFYFIIGLYLYWMFFY